MQAAITELVAQASEDTVRLVRDLLEQDVADRQWARQLGPCLTQRDVARLLQRTEQSVSKDPRLLRLRTRRRRPVYPVVQFAGRAQKPGIAEVVQILRDVFEPLTIASWLTGTNAGLGDCRPIDRLADGEVAAVVELAHRVALSAS